jgi:spore germination cell wall hydrolase CwlJ-like protein
MHHPMQANHSQSRIKTFHVAFFCLVSLFSGFNAFSDTLYASAKTTSPLSVQATALLSAQASVAATSTASDTKLERGISLPAKTSSARQLNIKTSSPLSVQAAALVSAKTSPVTTKKAADADPQLSTNLLDDESLELHAEETLKYLTQNKIVPLQEQVFRPVFDSNSAPLYAQELGCLAMNIYQEARGEPEKGKLAVAAVTMNRVKNKYYPSTVCGVVWQPKQFSWTNLKRKYHVIKNTRAWEKALIIAQRFIDGDDWPGVGKATHYHATTVSPNWKNEENLIAQVGNHLFYAL